MNEHENDQDLQYYIRHPSNLPWFELQLEQKYVDHIWKCIEQGKKQCAKSGLVGNITASYFIDDIDDYFSRNVIYPLVHSYETNHEKMSEQVCTTEFHELRLTSFWVNYQKKYEFNPIHDHSGVYSFVVWLKIPTSSDEENENPIAKESNSPLRSKFSFDYSDTLGNHKRWDYHLDPTYEGRMVFFPSGLRHQVTPFYNSDETRVSVSGNISLYTKNYIKRNEVNQKIWDDAN